MSTVTRSFFAALVGLALVTATASSRAAGPDDVRERASRSFSEAKRAFALRSYTAAATAFEEAARLVPHPAPWVDAAAAWELAGDPARAAEDCDRAIALAATGDVHEVDASERLQRLAQKVSTLDIRGPSSALVRVDAAEPVTLPARRRLLPGRHRLAIQDARSGEERVAELDLAAGATRTFEVEPMFGPGPGPGPLAAPPPTGAPAPPSPAPAARDRGGWPPPPLGSWIAFGVAGAATAATITFGVLTLDAKSAFESTPTRETLDRFERDRLITNVALVTAVVAAGVGVALWVWSPRRGGAAAAIAGRSIEGIFAF